MSDKKSYEPEDILQVCRVLWHDDNDPYGDYIQQNLRQFDLKLIEYIEIRDAILELPLIFRELLKMLFFDGVRHSQISAKLNFPTLYVTDYAKLIISQVCLMANYKNRSSYGYIDLGLEVIVKSGIWKDLEGQVCNNLRDPQSHSLVRIEFEQSFKMLLIPKENLSIL